MGEGELRGAKTFPFAVMWNTQLFSIALTAKQPGSNELFEKQPFSSSGRDVPLATPSVRKLLTLKAIRERFSKPPFLLQEKVGL